MPKNATIQGERMIDGSPGRLVDIAAGNDSTTYTGDDILYGIYVGTTGNVKVDDIDGTTVTFTAVPAGIVLPGKFTKVYATDTTASTIIGYQREV